MQKNVDQVCDVNPLTCCLAGILTRIYLKGVSQAYIWAAGGLSVDAHTEAQTQR